MKKISTNFTRQVFLLAKKSDNIRLIKELIFNGGTISEANALTLFIDIITNLCGSEVWGDTLEVLGYILDKPAEEVGEMEFTEMFSGVKAFFKEHNMLDFFRLCFTPETP